MPQANPVQFPSDQVRPYPVLSPEGTPKLGSAPVFRRLYPPANAAITIFWNASYSL
jgi:hypothetical protein